jgi:S1-C subfamily serine protease
VTAILSRTGGNQGIGFAVPVNLARYVMERIVVGGKVTRGYLVYRLTYNDDVAAGQLAVFQGASDEHI